MHKVSNDFVLLDILLVYQLHFRYPTVIFRDQLAITK
jgi:hypothetical protein